MNIMTDIWTIFGRDSGQIVERSYRYHADTDRVIEQTLNRSDTAGPRYRASPCPDECEWVGCEGELPGARDGFSWIDINADPFTA